MRPITRKRTPSAGTAGSRGAARAPTRSGRGQGGAPRSSGAARPRARGPAAARRLPPMGSAPRRRHGWPARRAPLPPDTCSPLLRPRRLPPAALLRPTARRGRAPAGGGGGKRRPREALKAPARQGTPRGKLPPTASPCRPPPAYLRVVGFPEPGPREEPPRHGNHTSPQRAADGGGAERFPARPAYRAASPARLGALAAKGGRGTRKTRSAERRRGGSCQRRGRAVRRPHHREGRNAAAGV